MSEQNIIGNVPKPTLLRLPGYLQYLYRKKAEGVNFISTTTIGEELNLYHVQVRKDLAAVGASGKPKLGYEINDLINTLVVFLDYDNEKTAVLAGAGQLGKTLLAYDGFANYGLNIAAAFDVNPEVIGGEVKGKVIYPLEKMEEICRVLSVHIGIITVPARHAQEVANIMTDCGIKAIWNFSPVHLNVPDDVIVQNENMAASLAVLSNKLSEKLKKDS
ncbi:MAG: redox-sensing transcriptional repressor Rex [Oscillospiraceae bacterium]|nr:redox-sensing transcriptional repressor Rex [Oscillospiraceae bacterium]